MYNFLKENGIGIEISHEVVKILDSYPKWIVENEPEILISLLEHFKKTK